MKNCDFDGCDRRVHSRGLCAGHYNQQHKGKPLKPLREFRKGGSIGMCTVHACDREKFAKDLCSAHWQQARDGRPFTRVQVQRRGGTGGLCKYADCGRPTASRFLCARHSDLERRGIPLRPLRVIIKRGDRFIDDQGYVRVRPEGLRKGKTLLFEHRVIVAALLGRPLLREETVHHKNGVRHDNRPENLELWSSSHPPGQRVEDKAAWAREILRLYEDYVPLTSV